MTLLLILTLSQALAAPPAAPVPLRDYLARPAAPLTIPAELGNTYTRTRIRAAAGGSVVLTTPRGDRFELQLPAGALPSDTDISLREITRLTHPALPASPRATSVAILPEGLQLQKPATLIIKPVAPLNRAQVTPFTTDDRGRDAHLAMAKSFNPTTGEVQLSLLHFSNYAVWDGPGVDDLIAGALVANEQVRIDSWFNHQLNRLKRDGGDLAPVLDRMFREMFNEVVLPASRGVTSCGSAETSFKAYISWSRRIAIMGGDESLYTPPGFRQGIVDGLVTMADQCYALAERACYTDHRPVEVAHFATMVMRWDALIGGNGAIDRRIRELADKCGRFRFEFESEIWAGEDRADSYSVTAKASFDFQLNLFERTMMEETIEVIDTTFASTGHVCERTQFHSRPTRMMINNFLLENTTEEGADFRVLFGNLTPFSSAKFACRDLDSGEVVEFDVPPFNMGSSFWGGMFMGLHGPTGTGEYDISTGFFIPRGWTLRHDTRYLSREYTQTVESLNESTSIVIYHRPIH